MSMLAKRVQLIAGITLVLVLFKRTAHDVVTVRKTDQGFPTAHID